MAVTANRSYPYPIAGDSPAGHTQIQALATAVDVDMANMDRWLSGYMTADINVASSTVLVNATGLSFAMLANSKYTFRANLFYSALTAARFKFGFTGPAGMTITYAGMGLDAASSSTSGAQNVLGYTASSLLVFGGATNLSLGVVTGTITTVATAGTFQIQFAQSVSNAAPTTLYTASTVVARRLT